MDTSNFDDSEADTTAEEFDAMWDKGAPVEAVEILSIPVDEVVSGDLRFG